MQTSSGTLRWSLLFLAAVIAAGFAGPARAQEENPDFSLLLEQQRVEAERQRSLKRMGGETEALKAHTAQLKAKAENCDALRAAAAAGAKVKLCEGDAETSAANMEAQSALGLVTRQLDLIKDLKDRVVALEESRPAAGGSLPVETPAAAADSPPPQPEEEPLEIELVFLDAATAVVRKVESGEDVRLRLRFDAVAASQGSLEGCVMVVRKTSGLAPGQSACFGEGS